MRYIQTNLSDSESSQANMSDSRLSQFVGSNVTSYTIPDLTPDTDYTIDVAGHTRIGMGNFSEQVSARTLCESSPPLFSLSFQQPLFVLAAAVITWLGLFLTLSSNGISRSSSVMVHWLDGGGGCAPSCACGVGHCHRLLEES